MASYYFRNTGDTNWGTASNWSLTDGGGATGAVPSSTDDAWFSNNSGNCVVNSTSRACKELNFTKGTGYTGTFTNTAGLTVSNSGNVTLNSGMTFTGSGTFTINTTSTVTTNGITIGCPLTIGGAGITVTLADNLTCSGSTLAFTTSGTSTLAGSYTIYFSGSTLSCAGVQLSSTVTLEVTGNVTPAFSGRLSLLEFKINCGSNTFTLTGTLALGDTTNSTKLTYVSGKVAIGSSSFLSICGTITLDTYPIEWNHIDFGVLDSVSKTFTLNSPLLAKYMRIAGVGTTASGLYQTFAGAYGFIVGTLICLINNTARQMTFQSGVTYRVKNHVMISGSQPQSVPLFVASTSGSKAMFLFDKKCYVNIYGVSLTDIDNVSPFIVPIFSTQTNQSVLSNSSGWTLITLNQQYIPPTTTKQGLGQGVANGLY